MASISRAWIRGSKESIRSIQYIVCAAMMSMANAESVAESNESGTIYIVHCSGAVNPYSSYHVR